MSRIKVFYIHHAQLALSILAIILAYATGNVILPGIFLYLVIVVIALSQFGIIGPVWLKVVAIESIVFYLIVELYNFTR